MYRYAHMFICICIYLYIHVCVCVCVCVRVCVCVCRGTNPVLMSRVSPNPAMRLRHENGNGFSKQ